MENIDLMEDDAPELDDNWFKTAWWLKNDVVIHVEEGENPIENKS